MNELRWQNIRPMNNMVLVAHEPPEDHEMLVSLDKPMNHFRVLQASDKCRYRRHLEPNTRLFIPNFNPTKQTKYSVNYREQVYLVPEEELAAVFTDRLYPLGKKLLLRRRLTSELNLDTGIIIPRFTRSKDQTNECDFICYGLLPQGECWPYEFKDDDIVVLQGWSMNQIDVRLHDGTYGLICPVNEVSHVESGRESLEEFKS